MKLLLHTEFDFDSAHQLEGHDGHCQNFHGHTYLCELWFKGDSSRRDKVGILVDFGIVREIRELLDHKNLNEVIKENPTAETISMWIYSWLKVKLEKNPVAVKVRLYETAVRKQTWCECGDFE